LRGHRLVVDLRGLDRLGGLLLDHHRGGDFGHGRIGRLHRLLDLLHLFGSDLLADQGQCRLDLLAVSGDAPGGLVHAVQDRVAVCTVQHQITDCLDRLPMEACCNLLRQCVGHPAAEAAQMSTEQKLLFRLLADVADLDLHAVSCLIVEESEDEAIACNILQLHVAEADFHRLAGGHRFERGGDGTAASNCSVPGLGVLTGVFGCHFGGLTFGVESLTAGLAVLLQALFEGVQAIVTDGVADVLPHRDLLLAPDTREPSLVLVIHQVVDRDVHVWRLADELLEFTGGCRHEGQLVAVLDDSEGGVADLDVVAGGHVAVDQFLHLQRWGGRLDLLGRGDVAAAGLLAFGFLLLAPRNALGLALACTAFVFGHGMFPFSALSA